MARPESLSSRIRALSTLGVTEAQLSRYPTITPQLREIGLVLRRAGQPKVTRRIAGQLGRGPTALDIEQSTVHAVPYGMGTNLLVSWPKYLQQSDDPVAIQVLGAMAKVDRADRSSLPVEAYCLAAGVAPSRILELITIVCVRMASTASQIIAAINHPRVVQKSVDMALTDEGIEDRTLLHKATGFLPTSKGPSQVVNVNTSANASAQAAATVVAAPPAENTIRRMVDRFNDARPSATQLALPPTSAVEIPAAITDAEFDLVERDSDA